jgi:uncharacterized protein HemX
MIPIEYLGVMIPILAIVLGIGLGFFATWTHHKQKIAKLQIDATAQNTAERAAQYASHVKELEDRVQVLERIVTDGGYDVATQIEALRDARRVEGQDAGVPLGLEDKENV